NVVGGVKVLETAADLALLAAVISSLRNRPLPMDLMVFGELGLSGEIRPVPSGQERLKEAAKHGFTRAIVPKANAPKEAPKGMPVVGVTRLDEALGVLFEEAHPPRVRTTAGSVFWLYPSHRGRCSYNQYTPPA